MKTNARYSIRITGIKRDRFMGQFIQQQIEKWIRRERSLLFLPDKTQYLAHLDWDEETQLYTFRVQIQIGSRRWENRSCERSAQSAVLVGLKGMKLQMDSFWNRGAVPLWSGSVA